MTRRGDRKGRRATAHGGAPLSTGDVNALLPAALHHHQQGDLERARALYEQLLVADPAHADGLQYFGILCDQCGDTQRAEALIRQAIAVKPDIAAYYDNLGTVLEHAGRLDDALSAYESADRLQPGDADRAFNLGLVLEKLGRNIEAEGRLRAALEQRREDTECQLALANLLKARGDLDEALTIYRQILRSDADHTAAHINLGNVLQDRGQLDEALAEYQLAIASAGKGINDGATAYHNQGRALLRCERFDEAQRAFEQALRLAPKLMEARAGLAQALERQGYLDRAYAAYRAVLRSDAADRQARAGLLRVARVLPPSRHDELLVATLLSAIAGGEISASNFARALGVQLAAKAQLQSGDFDDDSAALTRAVELQREPLFVVTLQQCVNVVPAVERWLCAVRRALLHADAEQLVDREPLLHALALQCEANEYVFAVTDAEIGVVDAVLAQLGSQTPSDLLSCEESVRDVLLCACYMPLTALCSADSLATLEAGAAEPWLALIVRRTVAEPAREAAIAATIATLAPIEDSASVIVRAQYEENPYPRWREMMAMAVTDVHADPVAEALARAPDASILVAGCGTGHEPLMIARRYPGHSVMAIDLSRASLAYAARMAEELELDAVEFMHGDLLDIERLGRKFQVIMASGVLHHLAQPLDGWRALRRCLNEQGIMKIALYSRRARATINDARSRIAELGLAASAHSVRTLRARILAGNEMALQSLLDSEDFYTTSVCRDLLFHPLEHQFDLHDIGVILGSLGLQFAGFELAHPLLRRQFVAAQLGDELDLAAWSRFEARNPQTFEAMYVMWCRNRPAAPEGEHA